MCMCVSTCMCVCSQSCLTLRLYGLQPAKLLCPWVSPGMITEVGYNISPFRGFSFLTNPCLMHWQADCLPLSHLGSIQLCMRDKEESRTILLTCLRWGDYCSEEIIEFFISVLLKFYSIHQFLFFNLKCNFNKKKKKQQQHWRYSTFLFMARGKLEISRSVSCTLGPASMCGTGDPTMNK